MGPLSIIKKAMAWLRSFRAIKCNHEIDGDISEFVEAGWERVSSAAECKKCGAIIGYQFEIKGESCISNGRWRR